MATLWRRRSICLVWAKSAPWCWSLAPVSLIKRVDVFTGGASAVYGSDAVTGVVNFILDDVWTGLRFDGSTEVTERGGGQVYDASVTGGLALGGRGNIVAIVYLANTTS